MDLSPINKINYLRPAIRHPVSKERWFFSHPTTYGIVISNGEPVCRVRGYVGDLLTTSVARRNIEGDCMPTNAELSAETRRKILDEFWSMIYETGLKGVNVRNLMKNIGMDRSTFYEYFENIPDLIQQAEEEILIDIGALVTDALLTDNNDQKVLESLSKAFMQYGHRITFLLGPDGDPGFKSKLRDTLSPIIIKAYGIECDEVTKDRIVNFGISAMVGTVNRFSADDSIERMMEEMVEMQKLIFYGISPYASRNILDTDGH